MKRKKSLLMATLLTMMVLTSAYAQIPTAGIQLWYSFTGNALDDSGNGYNGVNNGAILTTDRFSNPNAAYDFSAPGYIDCGNILDGTLAGAGKQFTVSLWIKAAGANNNSFVFAKNSDAGCGANERQFFIRVLNNKINVEYFGSTSGTLGRFICGSTDLSDTSHWYHIVVMYDGTINTNNGLDRVKVYVDNTLESTTLSCRTQSGSFPFDIATGNARIAIGNYINSTGAPCSTFNYNGKIDDLKVYNRNLTTTEVTQLYNEATGIFSYENAGDLSIYPNPARDEITVEIPPSLTAKSQIQIKDITGKVIYVESIDTSIEKFKQIKLNDFSKGVYFVEISSSNGAASNKKFIIQ